jgi:hypothetical protein
MLAPLIPKNNPQAIVDTLNSISVCRADTYYREYRDYIAEVRRRYPSIWSKCAAAK